MECPLRPLRLVPDDTRIQFMRGRFAGVIVSAVLSTLSIILFFYPGLNLGVDFRGGILVELRGSQALQPDAIRAAFAPLGFGDLRVQEFGSPQDVLVRFENKTQIQDAQHKIASQVAKALRVSRFVGSKSSAPRSAPSCFATACSQPGSPWSRC
jgi:preprotein translocase subunit SecF